MLLYFFLVALSCFFTAVPEIIISSNHWYQPSGQQQPVKDRDGNMAESRHSRVQCSPITGVSRSRMPQEPIASFDAHGKSIRPT